MRKGAPPQFDTMPADLKALCQWVMWKYELRDGKWTKPLYCAATGEKASHSKPADWTVFEAACACYRAGGYDGIGFVFTADDPFVGIDLDHCVDPETGEIAPWAAEWLALIDTYGEESPSGEGIHLILHGKLPGRARKYGAYECYEQQRYFTMTGRQIHGEQGVIAACDLALSLFYKTVFPENKPKAVAAPAAAGLLTDVEIVTHVCRHAPYERLWSGDHTGYGSQSEADLALAGRIAFFTGPDPAAIDRIFRHSGLFREKWDTSRGESTYGATTIEKALAGKREFYDVTWQVSGKKRPSGETPQAQAPDRLDATLEPSAGTNEPEGVGRRASGLSISNFPEEHPLFPMEVLPEKLARFVREAAASLPVPVDFIAVPMLAICGAVVGRSRMLEVKPGWLEGTRLWSAVIGDPGEKKTPAIKLVKRPLERQQAKLEDKYEETLANYEAKLAAYEGDLTAWTERRKKAAKDLSLFAEERPEKPEEPQMVQLFTTDTTVEALADVLKNNPRGIQLLRDELTAWVRGMGQYKGGKGNDRQAWLSFWSGDSLMINRKGEKRPVFLREPFVAVSGCLPPEVLGEFMDEQGREDGFIHRILFAYPAPVRREWTEATVSAAALADYEQTLDILSSLSMQETETSTPVPLVVEFTQAGKEAWVEWINNHHAEVREGGCSPALAGPWAKMEGYCASLALILQLLRYVTDETDDQDVDEMSVAGAAKLIDYHKQAARRVYPLLAADDEDRQVEQARQWVKRQEGGKTTARELLRNNVAGVKNATEAKRLLVEMEDRGWGEISLGEGPAKQSIIFTLF